MKQRMRSYRICFATGSINLLVNALSREGRNDVTKFIVPVLGQHLLNMLRRILKRLYLAFLDFTEQ